MIHKELFVLLAGRCTLGRAISATSGQQYDWGGNVHTHVMLSMQYTRMQVELRLDIHLLLVNACIARDEEV